ncbi:MAG TPA: hypothetical protein VF268_14445, partial [Gammaproteobacteria bacterium]
MDNTRISELTGLLEKQLARRQPEAWAKLEQGLAGLQSGFSNQQFFYLFAICPRWFAKSNNEIDADEKKQWEAHDPHGVLGRWQYPQIARLLVLLKVSQSLP